MRSAAYRKLSPYYHSFRAWVSQYPPIYSGLSKVRRLFKYVYPESPLAHKYLDGLKGLEIGAGAFNPFGLDTLNINHNSDEYDFSLREQQLLGHSVGVGLVALGDKLPFADGQWDFVLSSHVIEHFLDPMKALQEWYRVIRPGGYIFTIVPHKERTFDKPRARTTLAELIERHKNNAPNIPTEYHHNVWIAGDFLELCAYMKLPVVEHQDPDDKVGSGFTVVIRKP